MDTRIRCQLVIKSYDDLEEYDRGSFYLDESLDFQFSILETDNTYVTFEFNQKRVQLFYEPHDSLHLKEIVSGNRIHLSSGKDTETSYFAGYFNIEAFVDGRHVVYQFLVKPKNLQFENVVHLRKYVDSFYKGLSLDLSKTCRNVQDVEVEDKSIEKYLFLKEHQRDLLSSMQMVVQNGYQEVHTSRQMSRQVGKLKASGIRWLIQKGHRFNSDIHRPDMVMQDVKRVSVDVFANQVFKHEVTYWLKQCEEVIVFLEAEILSYEGKMDETNERIGYLKEKLSKMHEETRTSKRAHHQYAREKYGLDQRMLSYQEKLDGFKNDLLETKKMERSLRQMLLATWLRQVKDVYGDMVQFKDPRLQILLDYKSRYVSILSKQQSSFAHKPTPKLFETYIYIVLLQMFLKEGYVLEEVSNMHQTLSNPSLVHLVKGNQAIRIYYDQTLKRSNDLALEEEFVSINSVHNSPDFIVVFEEDGKMLDARIVEVKWRSYKNIYNEVEDTAVVDALKDYFNLGYHKIGDTKTRRAVISKVIVVFPDEEQRQVAIQYDEIVGVGLLPASDFETSIGFDGFKDAVLRKEYE